MSDWWAEEVADRNHGEDPPGKRDLEFPRETEVAPVAGVVVRGSVQEKMRSTVDQQGFPMLFQHAGGDRLRGSASRSRVTAEHANASGGGQSSVDVSYGRKKVGVHRIVAETVRGLSRGFPHALQFRPRHVLTASVPVECRLLRHTPALDHDRSHLPGEVGMTDQSNAHIGIHFSHVRLAEGDDIRLVKCPNQGPYNCVKARG